MTEYRLKIGNKLTGIVIRPDDQYPTLYRVHWPDRPPSDPTNLTRACLFYDQDWAVGVFRGLLAYGRGSYWCLCSFPFASEALCSAFTGCPTSCCVFQLTAPADSTVGSK